MKKRVAAFFVAAIVSVPLHAATLEKAIFSGGCFWCTESDFEKVPGVVSAVSGYTGGRAKNPGYLPASLAEAAIVIYWTTVGRGLASIRPMLVAVGAGGGVLALVIQAIAVSADRSMPIQVLTIASFLSSAALLGGACTAMILGHWYLIIPSMPVAHLQTIVKLHIASLVVRSVVVGAAGRAQVGGIECAVRVEDFAVAQD